LILPKIELLGVKVSAINPSQAQAWLMEEIRAKKNKAYVCVAPVSTLVDCQKDPEYRRIVNGADMVTPDGMPVVWLLKSKGAAHAQRTYGPDLMRNLCDHGRAEGIKHFLYGSTLKHLALLEEKLNSQYPGINIVGAHAPAFKARADKEDAQILKRINETKPDIVWVGLGSPKQDFWMALNRPFLDAPVLIGIGAAFDFLAGVKPQAPRWMQKIGLEWLFRLLNEPKRLWRRYLIGNTLFIFHLLKDMFSFKQK
jgi:N-acetylglucosaminyldiphosphoundecaprenol N-acetyl-beta-D-mannosaminyltransferase